MLTTLLICLLPSLPLQEVVAPLRDSLIKNMHATPWPHSFSAWMYDPVSFESGAITSAAGGYVDEEVYIQIPTLMRVHISAPAPFYNKHVFCNRGAITWTCRDSTVWQGEFNPQTWAAFDFPLAERAAELLNAQ